MNPFGNFSARAISDRAAGVAVVAASLSTLAAVGLIAFTSTDLHRDPCGLPSGVDTRDIASHVMACEDLEHHRISLAEYRALIGVEVPNAPNATAIEWASSVRSFSSQYTNSQWSAAQVLGAPDVYPRSADDPRAWASLSADAPTEFIEVGFATPRHVRELQVFETLGAGAISSVELITVSGARITLALPSDQPNSVAAIASFTSSCSTEPIVAARVTLASSKVAGWNEIDAIGALPCL